MKAYNRILLSLALVVCLCTQCPGATLASQSPPPLSREDAIRIAEAYHLWKSLGDKLWPGWTNVTMPFLYITGDHQYAINFPQPLTGYRPLDENQFLKLPVQVSGRTFSPNLSASFHVEGFPAVVFGTPAALEKSSVEWVLTASHEMFHVLQYARGSVEKIRTLALGPADDASWQLNYPFPYKDLDVMRLVHLQSYPVYLAINSTEESDIKYNAGTAVEAVRVYKNLLRRQSADDKFYKYSQFQEWNEGIAFYTEYKMAETAASTAYQPTEAFRQLPDYKSYQEVWADSYKGRLFLVKHAGRAAQTRTAFYHVGLGKGLLLDRLMPEWKARYFASSAWVNELLMEALGQPLEVVTLVSGSVVPDFNLIDANGNAVALNQFRGKVVLIDFWQTWCPPCVEEIPHLKSLQQKYKDQGLVILGVTDRLDREGLAKWREMVREQRLNYLTLLDEKGAMAAQYGVSGYPHKFIVDRSGRLLYDKKGYLAADQLELENQILKALSNKPGP